ncbi:hypothetical protein DTO021D3_1049 [Paecilomyces variotii]|nr:hypothetical protein DTO032I3_922 [Paecilomyces variotii]KAJ9282297.1 hypothetical protein DTO021D3_1049 [Paecilomyces variotii]KAJ9343645.1 hypothetical protein DTO027B6_3863 [Paecilomyces variotii]KAJ9351028.1 hypothetical protein DTO027B9_6613 [Paecilomyces variotii]KAJ9383116.1 hypothetical protein DTO032I4_5383 [Paecilomyces variotii]
MATTATSTRRNRGSEVILAYASPSTSPPSSESDDTSSISPLRDGRRRKNRDSSNDADDSAELPDGLVDEDFRAGGPYLCHVPVRSVELHRSSPFSSPMDSRGLHLVRVISDILRSYDIEPLLLDICGRISTIDPEISPTPTVVVLMENRPSGNRWIDACRSIRRLLAREGLYQYSVEIANVNAIDCFRMGYKERRDNNPPTVILSVERRSQRNWKILYKSIVHLLNSLGLWSVGVSIGPGAVVKQVAHPLDLYKTGAQAGVSLGVHGSNNNNNNKAAGTFAGWIEIENPRTNQWEKFGLTCFHCVDPGLNFVPTADQAQLKNWYINGVRAADNNARRLLHVDQPTEKDITRDLENQRNSVTEILNDATYRRIKNDLDANNFVIPPPDMRRYEVSVRRKEEYEKRIQRIQQFMSQNEHELGHVFSASGYRHEPVTTIKHSSLTTYLDWALIQVRPQRAFTANEVLAYGTPVINLPMDPGASSLILSSSWAGPIPHGAPLFKAGRTTGYSVGEYNGLHSAVIARKFVNGKWETHKTLEHSVCGRHGDWFSQEGDSGALIFDNRGDVVGMLFGGNMLRSISYFTHIVDLFNDIKKMTGATKVRIFGDAYGDWFQ